MWRDLSFPGSGSESTLYPPGPSPWPTLVLCVICNHGCVVRIYIARKVLSLVSWCWLVKEKILLGDNASFTAFFCLYISENRPWGINLGRSQGLQTLHYDFFLLIVIWCLAQHLWAESFIILVMRHFFTNTKLSTFEQFGLVSGEMAQ